MSESRTESGIILARPGGVRRNWKIRVMSQEPTLIDDTSRFTGTATEVHARAYILARRTSFMVNGPNRWVFGYILGQSSKNPDRWVQVFNFKTKLIEEGGPV